MARPPSVLIEIAKLKAFMRMKPTLADTAAFFECSEDSVENFIKKEFKVSFSVFREQNMVHTRFDIFREMVRKALEGDNTMLIWCSKNMLGWKDKHEISGTDEAPLTITYTPKSKRG